MPAKHHAQNSTTLKTIKLVERPKCLLSDSDSVITRLEKLKISLHSIPLQCITDSVSALHMGRRRQDISIRIRGIFHNHGALLLVGHRQERCLNEQRLGRKWAGREAHRLKLPLLSRCLRLLALARGNSRTSAGEECVMVKAELGARSCHT